MDHKYDDIRTIKAPFHSRGTCTYHVHKKKKGEVVLQGEVRAEVIKQILE
jgi:translation initiation factor 1 (eIF-1/SUI1)